VLDLRVYRAAFLPVIVAVFVAAFSLADRPAPSASPLPADAFDGATAFGVGPRPARNSLEELAQRFPARDPGSAGDAALADRVAATLGARDPKTRRSAFHVTRMRTKQGPDVLETVTGVRAGFSNRRIVVLAHRDALGRPGRAELSGTAALLELARVFRSRELRKTLVLVSTSGATTGFAGARAWARASADTPVDAVLVLGDLAGAHVRKPWVVPWSTSSGPAPLALQRTVEAAVRGEVGGQPGGARASGQWIRRAVPLTVSGQGVVNAAGLPAVLLGATGERGAAPEEPVRQARLQEFGRATLRAVTAIDAAGPAGEDQANATPAFSEGPRGIVTVRNVLPDWAVRVLVGTLLLPALVTALDAFFRARRRRLPAGRWMAWTALGALPVVAAWLWLRALDLVGALDVPAAPVLPDAYPLDAAGAVALGSVVLVAVVAWFGLRPLGLRRLGVHGSAAAGGLGAATGMLMCGVVTAVWVFNPYAAMLLVPAAHLWLLAAAPDSRLRGWLGAAVVVAGLLPLLLVAVHYARALGLDPLSLAWLALLATAGGDVSLADAVVLGLVLACLAGLLTVMRTRRRVAAAAEPEPLRTRGPAGYAGPGSLGGTESALRR
jgi:hypothetical protein